MYSAVCFHCRKLRKVWSSSAYLQSSICIWCASSTTHWLTPMLKSMTGTGLCPVHIVYLNGLTVSVSRVYTWKTRWILLLMVVIIFLDTLGPPFVRDLNKWFNVEATFLIKNFLCMQVCFPRTTEARWVSEDPRDYSRWVHSAGCAGTQRR